MTIDSTVEVNTQSKEPQIEKRNIEFEPSPLETRTALTPEELKSAADQARIHFKDEPEFNLTQDVETRHAQSLIEKVIAGDLTADEAALIVGTRMGELRMSSDLDFLTNMYNRGAGHRRLIETLYLGSRNQTKTTVMFIDLDGFKKVNDNLGHLAGDATLQAVGGHLSSTVRGSDIPFRYGGDEFGVIFPNTDISSARVIARKLGDQAWNAISSAAEAFGYKIEDQVTISAGLAEDKPPKGKDQRVPVDVKSVAERAQKLIGLADLAAKLAKILGKNRVIVAKDAEGILTFTDLTDGTTYVIEQDEEGKISKYQKLNI